MAAWPQLLAMSPALQQLVHADESVRRDFVEGYEYDIFPYLGTSTAQTKWWTFQNTTRVTLWGREHFQNNVRLFMVMEGLGLGPAHYCVMRTFTPLFSERLFLLLQFFPHQKICVYPYSELPFRGPFDDSVQSSIIGSEIYRRRLPEGELPNYCSVCHNRFCDHAMDGVVDL